MPEALKSIASESNGVVINFQYNDIEDFIVSTTIRSKSVHDAIKQVVGFYPISIKEDRQNSLITLECTNKTPYKYKGIVKSESGQPLEYANVVCLSLKDSSFVAGGVSNESGVFVIPCKREDVMLKVSYVGYDTKFVRCRTRDAGTILMHETIRKLAPITISYKQLQMGVDGYSLSLNMKDMQTSDVLTYLPNLSVINNSYCINGLEAEGIYINGQEIASPNELCNLPSEMVSSVKVDTKSRTINILLRSPQSGGFYGSVNAGCDFRFFSSHYDPDKFISNFHGEPTLTYKMSHNGYTLRAFADLSKNGQIWNWSLGFDEKLNISLQNVADEAIENITDLLPNGDYVQFVFGTHASASYQFGRKRFSKVHL